MGQNTNYLLDTFPPLQTEIDTLANSVALISPVNLNFNFGAGSGTQVIVNSPNGKNIHGAMLYCPQVKVTFQAEPDLNGPVTIPIIGQDAGHAVFWLTNDGGSFKLWIHLTQIFIQYGNLTVVDFTGFQIYIAV